MDSSAETPKPTDKTWLLVLGGCFGFSCLLLFVWLGCFGSLAWYASQEMVHATATAQQEAVVATATASARATAYAEFALVDTFDSNKNGWRVGDEKNEFWAGTIKIENGAYIWDFREIKKNFLDYSDYSNSLVVEDFDTYVDTKIIDGDAGSCSGILFRKSPYGWLYGGYAISVCKNGQFLVGYMDENSRWDYLSDWILSPAINKTGWNQIRVSGRGSHLTFRINDFIVFETADTHQLRGDVALFIESHGTAPMRVMFDNFVFQNK